MNAFHETEIPAESIVADWTPRTGSPIGILGAVQPKRVPHPVRARAVPKPIAHPVQAQYSFIGSRTIADSKTRCAKLKDAGLMTPVGVTNCAAALKLADQAYNKVKSGVLNSNAWPDVTRLANFNAFTGKGFNSILMGAAEHGLEEGGEAMVLEGLGQPPAHAYREGSLGLPLGTPLSSFGLTTDYEVPGWYKPLPPIGAVLGAYHGYKRTKSVGWAFGWFVFGGLLPFFAIPLALAQGVGKRK